MNQATILKLKVLIDTVAELQSHLEWYEYHVRVANVLTLSTRQQHVAEVKRCLEMLQTLITDLLSNPL